MTTKFRTLLLLGFTALAASLSGCILETTSNNGGGGGGDNCSAQRYFTVYWSVTDATGQLTCDHAPPSHVELVTNNGTYVADVECRAIPYMGFVFDFDGLTASAIPAGTYVTTANLVSNTSPPTILSTAPGAGAAYALPSCAPVTVAYPFDI